MSEYEQFNQAFVEHSFISEDCREDINRIKNNDPDVNNLVIRSSDGREVADQAWRLLGRYITNNTHLKDLSLDECELTDEQIISLFSGLTSSTSLRYLDLDANEFGIEGVRNMIPFLQKSPHLTTLYLGSNDDINNKCFELLASALNGKSIRELQIYNCNITDISALDRYNLPNLQQLNLSGNKIRRDGVVILAKLLQQKDTILTTLELNNIGIDNEGVEILATALKHNNKLHTFNLRDNINITEKGHGSLLNLLNDISSIENTYKSNHTITSLNLVNSNPPTFEMLASAVQINRNSPTSQAASRAKVIKYHLNSQTMEALCHLQGIEYIPGSILADIEPKLLPFILAMIGEEHGHSEFYKSLLSMAPDLMSFINMNRKAILEDRRYKIEVKRAALTAEYERNMALLAVEENDINNRLALIDSEEKKHSEVDEGKEVGSGEKRRRIN